MTKVIQRVDLTMRSFYIFNSNFGRKEGEESKKILYYHPEDIELNTKINDVGLSEAIIAFTGTFTNNEACQALHTQKTTQIFYQPEKDYWMVLVVNVPKEIRSKDGVEVADYKGGEVHDRIYRAALEQCYNMFRLFAGTFQMILANGVEVKEPREHLMQKLGLFYSKYLLTLKLPACDVMDALRSIQYLPLDKFLFLRVHNFIDMIQATFPTIVDAVFLYNEQVVCKIDPSDLYCLHEYLVGTIFPKTSQNELAGGSLTRCNSNASDCFRNGEFITGPENKENCTKPPKVYIMRDCGLQCFNLIVYRAMNATLCLLIHANEDPMNDFFLELHSFMGPQLASIASDIGETLTKSATTPNANKSLPNAIANSSIDQESLAPKYLFINKQSLKHISNISLDKRRPKINSIPSNVMILIADLNDNEHNSNDPKEVQVKTTNDFWIVKKNCNWRQFYVIIFNSSATLLDVTNEARRIFEQEITDDVFFDK